MGITEFLQHLGEGSNLTIPIKLRIPWFAETGDHHRVKYFNSFVEGHEIGPEDLSNVHTNNMNDTG